MNKDEFKFFMKYVGQMFLDELKSAWKGVTNLARPKLWLFIFSAILIYQIGIVRKRTEVIITLLMILFIWMWDLWEQGHWRGKMREEFYAKINEKRKENLQPPIGKKYDMPLPPKMPPNIPSSSNTTNRGQK